MMINRFLEKNGRANLILALQLQYIIHGNDDIAKLLAEKVSLHEYEPGSTIINQDSSEDCLYLILSGRVAVRVHDRDIAFRGPNTHVGEMSMIDPGARRSASIIAMETTVTACITNPDFCDIADRHPALWRYLAMELGNRLRQRNQFVSQPNVTPVIFLGSSKESLGIITAVIAGLDQSQVTPVTWTDDVFWPSDTAIEDLEAQLPNTDFAVLVFGPDDRIISRDIPSEGPRDNVLLEYGMFLGSIGRKRTYFLKPKSMKIKIPTDLTGLKPLEYDYDAKSGNIDVSKACAELMNCIKRYGVK